MDDETDELRRLEEWLRAAVRRLDEIAREVASYRAAVVRGEGPTVASSIVMLNTAWDLRRIAIGLAPFAGRLSDLVDFVPTRWGE